jgi:hypothetical protein
MVSASDRTLHQCCGNTIFDLVTMGVTSIQKEISEMAPRKPYQSSERSEKRMNLNTPMDASAKWDKRDMTTTKETCPKCGAEWNGKLDPVEVHFKCGSYHTPMVEIFHQSDRCRITELEKENERLRGKTETTCPFCKEPDFDLIGLKCHLLSGHCDNYNQTPAIGK